MHQGIKSKPVQQVTAFNKLTKGLLWKLILGQEFYVVYHPAAATGLKAYSLTGMDLQRGRNQNHTAAFKVITSHLKGTQAGQRHLVSKSGY